MRRRYKKFARKTYRFLRNRKRRRDNRFFGWLGHRVLGRELWKPDRTAVASGVAIGLAVAMLPPIPVQMILAAVLAVFLRANIPIAAAACWFSNPVTWAPILWLQKEIGDWVLKPSEVDEMHPNFHTVRCIALGAIVMAAVLVPLGYFLVYVLWDVVQWSLGRLKPLAAPQSIDSRQVMVKRPAKTVGVAPVKIKGRKDPVSPASRPET